MISTITFYLMIMKLTENSQRIQGNFLVVIVMDKTNSQHFLPRLFFTKDTIGILYTTFHI